MFYSYRQFKFFQFKKQVIKNKNVLNVQKVGFGFKIYSTYFFNCIFFYLTNLVWSSWFWFNYIEDIYFYLFSNLNTFNLTIELESFGKISNSKMR